MAKNKAMAFTGNRSISSIGISFLGKKIVFRITVANITTFFILTK